jgi:hypothetical protein
MVNHMVKIPSRMQAPSAVNLSCSGTWKNGHARGEYKFPIPKQPRLILLQLMKKFPVLAAPQHPSLSSNMPVIGS